MDINKFIIQKILKTAKEQNLTMDDLFNAAQKDKTYFNNVMLYKEDIDIFMFLRICQLFKVKPSEFIEDLDDTNSKF